MTKRFGGFTALDDVSIKIRAGQRSMRCSARTAPGKSTLVKCMIGYLSGRRRQLPARRARGRDRATRAMPTALGLGMVYQHFTLVPSMTAAENLVMARADVPRVIDWGREARATRRVPGRRCRSAFRSTCRSAQLAAGEKQKLEILKQLYLDRRFLILDEPTSMLTPQEAEEVLGLVRALDRARRHHHPDDHPQVPRGGGLRGRRDRAAPRQAGRRRQTAAP